MPDDSIIRGEDALKLLDELCPECAGKLELFGDLREFVVKCRDCGWGQVYQQIGSAN